ncbi:MAG TPA: vanadium-dependent haloperoxidase [Solirubrobacteraceae bacterium]|nr:vanadium-dependent haloperoxidase [Solirubrobacteraceae bacterium]
MGRLAIVLVLLLLATGAPAAAKAGRPVVEPWIEATLAEIQAHRTTPPRAARALAYVSVAMDAAARRPRTARQLRASVDAAAATMLAELFPDVRARHLSRVPRGAAARWGRVAARPLVERARTDGADATWTGTVPEGDGLWEPTPPAYAALVEPLAGTWRPWNLPRPDALRPAPPPAYGSDEFEAQAQTVYGLSRSLTAEQRRIAVAWADGPGSDTPPGHWNRIALKLLTWDRRSARRSARLFATLNTAQADAFIACWEAKFAYWLLRPVTAIRARYDPEWLPLLPTPPFPAYPSGHAATSGAAATVLEARFPTHVWDLRQAAREAALSRIYGGIHFPVDGEAGLDVGRRAARAALANRAA